jgi:ATP-binding cassette subfamily B protein
MGRCRRTGLHVGRRPGRAAPPYIMHPRRQQPEADSPQPRGAPLGRPDHAMKTPPASTIANLEVDLDRQMRFARGMVALTPTSLVDRTEGAERSWPLRAETGAERSLRLSDHAGLGLLELLEGERRLQFWRFTLDAHAAAVRFAAQFEAARRAAMGDRPAPASPSTGNCPTCQAPMAIGSDECTACQRERREAPSSWVLLRLRRFAVPYRWQLLLGITLMLAATAARLVPPYLTIPLMDDVLVPFQAGEHIEPSRVAWLLAGLLGSAVVAWLLGWMTTWLLAVVSERVAADMRIASFEHLLGLSLDYFGAKRTGDLMARIGSDTDRISIFLSIHALDFVTDLLMLVMTSVILFSIDPWLALATLVPLPVITWLIQAVRGRLRMGFEKIGRAWSDLTNVLADTIPGIRVVKAFAQERRESQRFREANRMNLMVNDRLNRTWSLFFPTVTLLTDIGVLVVWAFGIWQVSQGQITVGVLTAFIAYIGRFYVRLESMSRIVSVTQKAAAGAKRLFDILDHASSVPEPARPVPITQLEGRVTLEGVGFRYGNRSVLRGLDLDIRPGEMVGLVGHSGSGKSTLVNLICRFYDASEGTVRVDGTDVRRFGVSDYRRHIGLVLQEPFLFFGTIAENIAYGRPDATRADIVAAARAARAHEFILRLPHGYDSQVGERGQGLSGGERQRISIARALLIDPRILILDEATSSVDTETEKEIQAALDNLVRGRTTIAIAHRISTLRKADRIVVLDRGQVVEVGPHDELMTRRGAYWRIHEAQAHRADGNDDVPDGVPMALNLRTASAP